MPALIPDREQRPERGRLLRGLSAGWRQVGLGSSFARRYARVDDPDWVCDNNGCAAGEGTSKRRLDGGEFPGGAAGLEGGFLKPGAGPFVSVVVHEVGDTDAEERGVEASVESWYALSLYDAFRGVKRGGTGAFRFDLGACGDERVAVDS